MGEACGMYGGVNKYRVDIIRLEQSRPLGRTRERSDKKSPQEHKEIRSKFVEWTDLAQHTKP
jgi:hypothetical protein